MPMQAYHTHLSILAAPLSQLSEAVITSLRLFFLNETQERGTK